MFGAAVDADTALADSQVLASQLQHITSSVPGGLRVAQSSAVYIYFQPVATRTFSPRISTDFILSRRNLPNLLPSHSRHPPQAASTLSARQHYLLMTSVSTERLLTVDAPPSSCADSLRGCSDYLVSAKSASCPPCFFLERRQMDLIDH